MAYADDRKFVEDYYKMLSFLNESTNDHFFVWDIRENVVHFAKEINKDYEKRRDDIYTYRLQTLKDMIYSRDKERLLRLLGNIADGNESMVDVDFRYLDQYGKKCWINGRGKAVRNDRHQPFMVMGCLSRRVLAEKIDMLTGLRNYNKMLEDMGKNIARGRRGHLMVLGIDGFRDVNQRMGRSYGNKVLKQIAEILDRMKGEDETIYRLDGDHFAVDLMGRSRKETEGFFQQIQDRMDFLCTFSAGVVCYPFEKETDINILISYADNAMTRAKEDGKNRMVYFSSEDYNKTLSRIELRQEMRESIRNGFEGFELYYQPQVTSNEYELHGAEALLRYHSKKFGFMSPVVFIPVLEQSGLIVPVGKWVMKQAFEQCAKWRRIKKDFNISVNVSYVQLQERTIVDDVIEAAKEADLPGNLITVEITESMQLQNYNYFNDIFYSWRNKGMHISIDDFGTGYSSLSYLKGLEIDEVKIDRCFVRQIQKSAYNYRLLSNMLELTHSAQIRVCCEGVEDEEELRCLDSLFPELIQGFLFGRPMPAEEFEKTCLMPSEEYVHLIQRLSQSHEKNQKENERFSSIALTEEQFEYRRLLDHLEEVIYLVDMDSLEVYFMNDAARKFTGVYNYFGAKCYQVFSEGTKKCTGCMINVDGADKEEHFTGKMLYEFCGEHMGVREKIIKWDGRDMKLVVAWPLDEDSRLLAEKFSTETYTLEQIVDMYAMAAEKQSEPDLMKGILDFAGRFYQADRVCLFLHDEQLDVWQDVLAYHDKGIMDKKRYFELTTSRKMEPWVELLSREKAVCISSTEEYREKENVLWRGLKMQNISTCMLCGIWSEKELIGCISVDDADSGLGDMRLLKRASHLIQEVLCHKRDKRDLHTRLHQLVEKKLDHDILSVSGLGLWQIKINKDTGKSVLLADDNMRKLIEADDFMTPAQCYERWNRRIHKDYLRYVNNAVETMIATGDTVEVEYPWKHSERGWVRVRCVGTKTTESGTIITLEGYHRLLDDLQRFHPGIPVEQAAEN